MSDETIMTNTKQQNLNKNEDTESNKDTESNERRAKMPVKRKTRYIEFTDGRHHHTFTVSIKKTENGQFIQSKSITIRDLTDTLNVEKLLAWFEETINNKSFSKPRPKEEDLVNGFSKDTSGKIASLRELKMRGLTQYQIREYYKEKGILYSEEDIQRMIIDLRMADLKGKKEEPKSKEEEK